MSLGLGLLVILPILRYMFDISDMTCAILGALSKCAGDFLYAIAHSKMMVFLSRIDEKIFFQNICLPSSNVPYALLICGRRNSIVYFQSL